MSATKKLLEAVSTRGWQIVLLRERDKRPAGGQWTITSDTSRILSHLKGGGNVGLVCGPKSGVAVLDFDDPTAFHEMSLALGPLAPTVRTGSGKNHVYVKWMDGLPAKMRWHVNIIGEIQRGGENRLQHVVCPPSIHPNGESYTWLIDPSENLPELPEAWQHHFFSTETRTLEVPDFVIPGDTRGTENARSEWDGPTADIIIEKAWRLPGARKRKNGIKAQCEGCRREGHDRSRDNAFISWDGRWSCALNSSHKRAIGESLGISRSVQLGDKAPATLGERGPSATLGERPQAELGERPKASLL